MKIVIGMICSLVLAVSAYGQTTEVRHREVDQPGGVVQHEKATKHVEMQGSPKQIHRMQKDQDRFEGSNTRVEGKVEGARVEGNTRVEGTTNRVETRPNVTESKTTTRVEKREGRYFFGGREIHQRRDFDRNDWHFRFGFHPRTWWVEHYSTIVDIDGCWYYEDGGYLWPAYGYDPNCSYPDTYVVFTYEG